MEIKKLQTKINYVKDSVGIEEYLKQLEKLVQKEEILWKQRSKSLWLKDGDRNTKFFHAMASRRKRNNRLLRIIDEERRWQVKEEKITTVFLGYFISLYSTSNPINMEQFYQTMDNRISIETNSTLVREFIRE